MSSIGLSLIGSPAIFGSKTSIRFNKIRSAPKARATSAPVIPSDGVFVTIDSAIIILDSDAKTDSNNSSFERLIISLGFKFKKRFIVINSLCTSREKAKLQRKKFLNSKSPCESINRS